MSDDGLEALDRELLNAVQWDFPLEPRPFAVLGERLGLTEAEVRELLAIPAGVALAGHISVGYRSDPWPRKLRRNPVSDFVFGERYGEAL